MAPLSSAVDHDLDRALTVVTFTGDLSLATAVRVRAELLEWMAECPLALVVDVGGLLITSQVALMVFPAVQRQQRYQHDCPTVPILLCAAATSPTGLVVRRVLDHMMPVYPNRERAVAAALAGQEAVMRVDAHLAADPRSAGIARQLVANACDDWGLTGLKDTALLVVSELVSNAVRYAGSDFDLIATLRGRYLHLAVRDGNPKPPLMPSRTGEPALTTRGRGLQLIDSSATAWGTMVAATGKVVWATLSIGIDRG